MWSHLFRGATRFLLALGMVSAVARCGPVQAAVPTVDPDATTPPARDHHRHRRPPGEEPDGQVRAHATHHHEAEGPRGTGPPGKAAAGKPDLKAHPPEPVAVAPPVPRPVPVAPVPPAAKDTGEPPPKIPRFAALKTDETNMRKGPGQRYPIEWVYQRHDLPVEVEREYDVWRYVRDPDGVEGWVHQVTLSDRRTFVIQGKDAMLRSDAKDTASAVALLKVGVIGRLRQCDEGSQWCQVQVAGYKGYLRRDQFWGLLPDEVLSPS
jgi:SH3-like domain-containing protein